MGRQQRASGLDGDRSTSEALRRFAAAALAGSVLAIGCELLLRAALGAVSVEGFGGSTDWVLADGAVASGVADIRGIALVGGAVPRGAPERQRSRAGG